MLHGNNTIRFVEQSKYKMMSKQEDDKESIEPDYDDYADTELEQQEEGREEVATNQVFQESGVNS
jgi:hypothetical protein